MVAGVAEDQVAVASTGVIGVPLPIDEITARDRRARRASCAPTAASDFAEAIRTTDAFPKQVTLDVRAVAAGTVRLSVQAKGAGMISPNFATLLVFVQTDAALDADEADLLLSVCTQALVRPDQRRRPALDLRHDRAAGLGRLGRADRAEDRRRARLRRGARRGPAPGRAAGRQGRRGRPPGRSRRRQGRRRARRRAGRARGRRLAAGQDRAVRRRPQLGPDHPGRGCGAARGRAPLARRHLDRGHRRLRQRRLRRARRRGADRRRAGATRSSTRSCCRARAPRPSATSPTSATSTSRSTRTTRHERRRASR